MECDQGFRDRLDGWALIALQHVRDDRVSVLLGIYDLPFVYVLLPQHVGCLLIVSLLLLRTSLCLGLCHLLLFLWLCSGTATAGGTVPRMRQILSPTSSSEASMSKSAPFGVDNSL